MAFPFLLLAGALLGKKKQEQEQAEFNRQREIQAETTRMSPWTGMQAAAPKAPKGKMANMASGAMSGWAMQQSLPKEDLSAGTPVDSYNEQAVENEVIQPNYNLDPAAIDGNKFDRNLLNDPRINQRREEQRLMGYKNRATFGNPWEI